MFQLLIICSLSCILSAHSAVRTNSNEVTDFYDKNLESKSDFFDNYHGENNRAVESIKAGSNHEMLEGYAERDSKAAHLSDIRAVELEGQGRHARNSEEYSFYDENELEPNWSKAGNRMHKEDADELASATARLFTDLMDKLRELGLTDCKSVKGDKVKEPIYMIDIKREPQRNTEYDQFFCEELKNRYSCSDTLKLRCSRRGIKWGPWQNKVITFDGHFIYHNAKNWGYAQKWKRCRWGWHITPYHPPRYGKRSGGVQVDSSLTPDQIILSARQFIANQIGAKLEQVGVVTFPSSGGAGRGYGATHAIGERWRIVFDKYDFGYQFREGNPICTKWVEDWTETCRLR